jgi:hypothetical protein
MSCLLVVVDGDGARKKRKKRRKKAEMHAVSLSGMLTIVLLVIGDRFPNLDIDCLEYRRNQTLRGWTP